MIDALHKLPKAKPADPHYCEALGRACRSKACDLGCKMLRGRAKQPAVPKAAVAVRAAEPAQAGESAPMRERRAKKPSAGSIDLSTLASDDHLSVLKAALAGLEQVDLVMSMAARMLGIAQAGTALEDMRETKRRLATLIAEVGSAKSGNDAGQ
jgi:hypothetical protein